MHLLKSVDITHLTALLVGIVSTRTHLGNEKTKFHCHWKAILFHITQALQLPAWSTGDSS